MNDRSLICRDDVGPVLESSADVIYGGLAVFYVEGCSFEEDIGFGGSEPLSNVSGPDRTRQFKLLRQFASGSARAT